MHILEFFYEKIIKHDLLNKFSYSTIKNIPKLKKIILNFGCNSHNIKNISSALLSLELISNKQSRLTKTKTSNIFIKIRKGAPVGCYVVLKKKNMYKFLFKLLIEIFPMIKDFKGIPFSKKPNIKNNFSSCIEDLITLK